MCFFPCQRIFRELFVKKLSRHILVSGADCGIPCFPDSLCGFGLLIILVVFLLFDKFSKLLPAPWVVHWWYVGLFRFGRGIIHVYIRGFCFMFRYRFQGIDIPVIYTTVLLPIKCLYKKHLCSFAVMHLKTFAVEHAVVLVGVT